MSLTAKRILTHPKIHLRPSQDISKLDTFSGLFCMTMLKMCFRVIFHGEHKEIQVGCSKRFSLVSENPRIIIPDARL
jgi:hypothetical protein